MRHFLYSSCAYVRAMLKTAVSEDAAPPLSCGSTKAVRGLCDDAISGNRYADIQGEPKKHTFGILIVV